MSNEQATVPISSLIDIVFLLIMFFVATATIDEYGMNNNVDLALAKHMKAQENQSPSRFTISLDDKGRVYITNQEASLKTLQQDLRLHSKYFGNRSEIQIRADKKSYLSDLEKIIKTVNECGMNNIKIISQLESDHE